MLIVIIVGCRSSSSDEENLHDSTATNAVDSTYALVSDSTQQEAWIGLGNPQFGDLDSMISRRRIRVLVPYTHAIYYLDGKERRGIAFEAMNVFEKELNKHLKFHPEKVRIVFVPTNRQQLIPLLQKGYGDMIFAGLTILPHREAEVDFSMPTISGLKEIIVGGPTAPQLHALRDVSGQHVYVHAESSYFYALQKLSDSLQSKGLQPIKIEPVDPYLEVEDLLEMVNSGGIPFTVMMEDAARLWTNALDSLSLYTEFPISKNVSYAWAFRKDSPQLKQFANEFLKKNRKGSLLGNMLYNKYVKSDKSINHKYSINTRGQVKALESLFRQQAEKYSLDWLLLVAQGYQESKLNQKLVSHAGAVGIMQVKPGTAAGKPINISNVYRLENNVEAGAKYLRYVIDQFFDDEEIDHFNRELMALASYNAGPSRIAQLRKKTSQAGLNPNIWFDNVEIIVAREIGRETVQYVSNIYKFYSSYKYLREYAERRGRTVLPQ